MPESIDKIRKDLADTALYHGMSYAAIVGVASEIEAVTDKQERAALRREFRAYHSLTAVVWARVQKRFSQYDLNKLSAQQIRAMAYCCQLKKEECYAVYNAHLDHIEEPGALCLVLRDVNSFFDARRNGHAAKRATLAEQITDIFEKTFADTPFTEFEIGVLRLAPVSAELKRRGNAINERAASILTRRGKAEK